MRNRHANNTIRYYIVVILFLGFLFLSNDFGLIDTQKTAIVMAVGIDREGEEFTLTSQIAIPKSSDQGKSSQAVQLVSKGKTVAEAFEEVNAKTGWYPKLVFCKLLLFGQSAKEYDAFDALDFFLRDEYFSNGCQVAVCEGKAEDVLSKSALVDPSSSVAILKVLSPHAERVGTVLPCNLKDFAIGYYGDSRSSRLPVIKIEAQKEDGENGGSANGEQEGASGDSPAFSPLLPTAAEGGQGEQSGQSKSGEEKKPVFSARETALFVGGIWRDTLTAEETFAVSAAIGKLRLASYTVSVGEAACALSIKRNLPKIELKVSEEGRGELKIGLKMIAGALDYSKAQGLEETKDMGATPVGAFASAEKSLRASLITAYEKAKGVGCDVFSLQERLVKYKARRLRPYQEGIVDSTTISVQVRFESVR